MPKSTALVRLVRTDVPLPSQAPVPPGALPASKPLGQILLERRQVDPANLVKAAAMRERCGRPLGDILLAHDWVREQPLIEALAEQWRCRPLDPLRDRGDPRLIDLYGAGRCLTDGLLPYRRLGGTVIVATSRPEEFEARRAALEACLGPVIMALAAPSRIEAAIAALKAPDLARAAEYGLDAGVSCRGLSRRWVRGGAALGVLILSLSAVAPRVALSALMSVAAVSLVLATALKCAAFAAAVSGAARRHPPYGKGRPARLPVISVLIPLFREAGIAERLVARLSALDYPRELTDILLVVEDGDTHTREALSALALPGWMRVIAVPPGQVLTKPRALNYALNFARGSIVGVWDAEDMPEPAQLLRVAEGFASAPADVACLQGALDYYSARRNWLARCFTIEYASWFRAVLPGLARLGLVVPLGGTTLFFRREALDAVGGWDAHNVTEDADLGVRLARRGYRTGMLASVTQEEPNARLGPWIRQRSRWLKGYAMTWASHSRDPRALLRDLGAVRFVGMQVLFLGTLLQFALAPVLWLLWLLPFGWPAALPAGASGAVLPVFAGLCLASEAGNIAIGLWAVRRAGHRHLMVWVPSMLLYFPLASVAVLRAAWDVARRPFHWEKTEHGIFDPGAPDTHESLIQAAPGRPALPPPARLPPLVLLNPVRPGKAPASDPDRIAALIPRAAGAAG